MVLSKLHLTYVRVSRQKSIERSGAVIEIATKRQKTNLRIVFSSSLTAIAIQGRMVLAAGFCLNIGQAPMKCLKLLTILLMGLGLRRPDSDDFSLRRRYSHGRACGLRAGNC